MMEEAKEMKYPGGGNDGLLVLRQLKEHLISENRFLKGKNSLIVGSNQPAYNK